MILPQPDELLGGRLGREKQYHDERFGIGVERRQAKYYYSVGKMEGDFKATIRSRASGADILEYGCGTRTVLHDLARSARTVTGIDISDVAISRSTALARERRLENASFFTMDAEAMSLPENSFDLIFGSGIIHHLDVKRSMRELQRVLRPGGAAVFLEPLGHNPIINLYRLLTPSARTADEHPLLRRDFQYFAKMFPEIETKHYGLLSLASVPLRNTAIGPAFRDILVAADNFIFQFSPLRWLSWFVLIELRK